MGLTINRTLLAGVSPPEVATGIALASTEPVRRRLNLLSPGLSDTIGMAQHRFSARMVRARREILREGEMPTGIPALRSGWAALARHFPDGRRQLQHILVPGDLLSVDRDTPYAVSVVALTPVALVDLDVPHGPDGDVFGPALRRHALLTVGYLLNATARLGRQSALERFAHLLLELRERLSDVGLAGPSRFDMPLTQEMLADTLGLTSVHVNRTLQSMRQQGLIALSGREVTLLQPEGLARLADYHPAAAVAR